MEHHDEDEHSHAHNHDSGDDHDDHGDHSHDHDHDHSHPHHEISEVSFGVVTVSSSRTLETDEAGDALVEHIESEHTVGARELVGDHEQAIAATVLGLVERDDVEAIVTTGGTGLSPADVTLEAVRPLFDRPIPGFGELFRYLSYEDVGPHAMLSRAFAGTVDGVPVFCLPGSKQAVTFGTEKLVVPTIGHILGQIRGH